MRTRSRWSLALPCLALALASWLPAPRVLAHDPAPGARGTLSAADVAALVGQLTLAEKVSLVHGAPEGTACNGDPGAGPLYPVVSPSVQGCMGQAGYVPGVARLGVPPLRLTDGPAGIRLGRPETALPAPVGLAATFDRGAARTFGALMGREGRATNQDVLLAPMLNQVTVPTGGRNFETLGEDPFLLGALVAEEVRGVQGEGLVATLKHYAMNDFENGRTSTSVQIGEQALHELEASAFGRGVDAGAGAIMCAYNRVNDVYACSNALLQEDLLRGQLGFSGFVMSDWGATRRLSDLLYGLDLAMPNGNAVGLRDEPDPGNLTDRGTGLPIPTLTGAVNGGTAALPLSNDYPAVPAYGGAEWSAGLDRAVTRLLTALNDVGLLEGTPYGSRYTGGTPYVPPRGDLEAMKPAHFAIARALATRSATLLRNERGALPLSRRDLAGGGLLVLGPTAVAPYVGGGGSAHVIPYDDVPSPLAALRAAAPPGAHVAFLPGYDLDGELVPSSAVTAPADSPFAGQQGLVRTQIATAVPASGLPPAPCAGDCAAPALEPVVDHATSPLPAGTAWRWQAVLRAPAAGTWQLKIFAADQASAALFVDGLATAQRRISMGAFGVGPGGFGTSAFPSYHGLAQTQKSHDPALPRMQQAGFTVTFAAGETHALDLRAYASAGAPLRVRLVWVPPDLPARAVAAAAAAAATVRKVLIFVYDEGTEGVDRGGNDQAAGLRLPGYQDDLVAAVAAANPNTVVVLNTGDPVLMPWVGDVAAILEMWYPGQRGGEATAAVLLGDATPGGKLPVTFPADPTLLPTASASCDPAAITTSPPADGGCRLYPGVYAPGFVSGSHGYKTIDFAANGILQGYRWYDAQGVDPLFPFGHGLSYTSFRYSGLGVWPGPGGVVVTFTVRNVGRTRGAEVPQVYVGPPRDPPSGAQFAVRKLAGFDRVELAPGQEARVRIVVTDRELSYWSEATHAWTLPAGGRRLSVGASSRDLRLEGWVPGRR